MFLALRDLRVQRGRFVLVGAVIALVAVLSTIVSGLATGLVDDGISGLRSLPLTHLAFQPGAKASFSRSILTEVNLGPWEDAAAGDGFDVSPLGVSFFNARSAEGTSLDMALFGVPPDSFLIPDERGRDALAGEPGLVLSEEFRSLGISEGDMITVSGIERTLPVVGFTFAGSYGHVDIAFTSLQTWQELVYGDTVHDRFSAVAIRATDTTDFPAVNTAAGTETRTKTQAYAGSPGYSAETATINLIRGFLLVISALIVGAFFTVWTVQRSRQIGLLKALGASNVYVIRDALGQLALVLTAATLIGTMAGVGMGSLIGGGIPFALRTRSVALSVVALIVIGMAGSLVALRKVTSVDPIIALAPAQ